MKKITALLLVMMCALGAWAQTDKETPLTLDAERRAGEGQFIQICIRKRPQFHGIFF